MIGITQYLQAVYEDLQTYPYKYQRPYSMNYLIDDINVMLYTSKVRVD